MNEQLSTQRKYPESVQPGIPKLKSLKQGWQRRKIGELLKEVNRPVSMDDSHNYNLVTVKRARGGVVKRNTKKGKDIAVKSQFVVQAGDFLISKRQIVHGACGIVPDGLDGSIVSNEYSVLNCTDLLDSSFLNYLTHTTYFQQTCFHSSIGVHIEKMIFKLEDWFNWKIDIPALPEQQKIAAFLGAVDKKLEALRRKRELLQSYKRGMMQKIFSQELRFKADDGTEFPEWEKKRLNDIAKINPNSRALPEIFLYIDLESVTNGKLNIPRLIHREAAPSRAQRTMSKGDILFQMVRPYQRNNFFFNLNGEYVASTGYAQIRTQKYKLFLYHLLHTDHFVAEVILKCTGTGYPAISASDLGSIMLLLPTEIDEQQKIADFLSAIDAKIEAVTEQITKMEQFKKGLLQQLFV